MFHWPKDNVLNISEFTFTQITQKKAPYKCCSFNTCSLQSPKPGARVMHRLSSIRKFGRKISQAVGLRPTPTPAWPLQSGCDVPEIQDQLQSLLFGKLSIELRIIIYELVLGDPKRFLHICLNRGKKAKKHRKVAHWRCDEMDIQRHEPMNSPCPTWQHWCFGDHPIIDRQAHHHDMFNPHRREITVTEDQLIAILLSCRRMYVATYKGHPRY